MPLKWFICPDGQKIEVGDCLKEGGCRMNNRCATRSYLKLAAQERPWTGKPSTTQLIAGTLYAFLKLVKDYAVAPDSKAFMINGTNGHAKLEEAGDGDEYSKLEEVFANSDISGISDVIEEELSIITLWDYKVSGSFKVQKALGYKVVEEETDEVYKTGKRKGEKKTTKILVYKPEIQDTFDWTMQENKYRIEYEKKSGKKIAKLKIQIIVRDGNTYIARQRGVFLNVYTINIPILEDSVVQEYFNKKKEDLFKALEQGHWNEICTKHENWDGLKCEKYCEVAEFCNYGKYLKRERITEGNMPIEGLSEQRRMPRLGHLRLGEKKVSPKTGNEYPVETDHFILDPVDPIESSRKVLIDEFKRLFADPDGKVRSIRIMLPVDNMDLLFPTYYKRYGSGTSLQCKGDGIEAVCPSEEFAKGLKIIGKTEMGVKVECAGKECPFYKANKCSENAVLNVLIPDLPGVGVWQIVTGSINSILNINSSVALIRQIAKRANMVWLTLKRIPQETSHDGKKATHYPITIDTNIKMAELQQLATVDPTKTLLPTPEITDKDLILTDGVKVNKETGEIIEAEQTDKNDKPADADKKQENIPAENADKGAKSEEKKPEFNAAAVRTEIINKLKKFFSNNVDHIKVYMKETLKYESTKAIPDDKLQEVLAKIEADIKSEENIEL